MSPWNFRIIFHDADDYPWYGVHEVYYNQNDTIYAYTKEAMDLTNETEKELREYINMVQRDVNRNTILVESKIVLVDADPE
jgi:hypothetical protein